MFDDSAGGVLVTKAANLRLPSGRHNFVQFDEENVQSCAQCINSSWNMMHRDLGNPHVILSDSFYQSRLQILRAQALHNKRCMCAYMKARIDHITSSWWGMRGLDEYASRASMGEASQGTDIPVGALSDAEREFLRKYEALNVSYMKALGGVDLRLASGGRPPSIQRHVILKGLEDYIGISTVSGRTIEIYPGKCLNVTFEDAMPLLVAGVAEEIQPPESRM
ncbi:DNA replication complex GINS protein PSF1 [Perkinsela sp. CCAP 1560/4]|nr:DNA replication complex GINS protein PSF1 [Perkinsela sp. CCAP 1560/4]|eukprot:KNH06811.1 DNA replication complex GINS protein PSF1 [Perkinsela sp. CCAP 1560/4]